MEHLFIDLFVVCISSWVKCLLPSLAHKFSHFKGLLSRLGAELELRRSDPAKGASLVAHMVKKLPAMQETQVPSLGQEDPLEKGTANHSSILSRRILWTVCSIPEQLEHQENQPRSHRTPKPSTFSFFEQTGVAGASPQKQMTPKHHVSQQILRLT